MIVLGIYVLVPRLGNQFPEFAEQARGYWTSLGANTQGWVEYSRSHRMPGPLLDAINSAIPGVIERVSQTVSDVLTSMVAWLAYIPWLVLIPVLSFFLLKDVDTFRRSALQMLPRGRWRWRGDEFFQDVNSTLAAYIRAQLTACLFIGVVCAIGFTLLGLPSPLVLGVIAGVFEFVPLVGPLLVAVMAAVAGCASRRALSRFPGACVPRGAAHRSGLCRLSAFDWPGNSSASAGSDHRDSLRERSWPAWREFFWRFRWSRS